MALVKMSSIVVNAGDAEREKGCDDGAMNNGGQVMKGVKKKGCISESLLMLCEREEKRKEAH